VGRWWTATRTATDSVPGLGACGTRNIARLLSLRKNPNGQVTQYVYLFAHPTQSTYPIPGDGPGAVTVGHATEIPYVFGDVYTLEDVDGERELARKMGTYWINFAKNGVPSSSVSDASGVEWPMFTSSNDQVLRFDVDVKHGGNGINVQTGLRRSACDWQDQNRVPFSIPTGIINESWHK
jgi:hypothetical protein